MFLLDVHALQCPPAIVARAEPGIHVACPAPIQSPIHVFERCGRRPSTSAGWTPPSPAPVEMRGVSRGDYKRCIKSAEPVIRDAEKIDSHLVITSDGRVELAAKLVLVEKQGGVVGVATHRLEIDPSGSWRETHQIRRGDEPELRREGRLDADQLRALASALTRAAYEDLDEKLGTPQPANVHSFELEFGSRRVEITGVPTRRDRAFGDNVAGARGLDAERGARLNALVQTIADQVPDLFAPAPAPAGAPEETRPDR